MKILKSVLAVLGAAGVLVCAWFLFQSWVGIGKMMAVAVSNRSAAFPSPMNDVYLATGLGLVGGLLVGLAIGLPAGKHGGRHANDDDDAAATTPQTD